MPIHKKSGQEDIVRRLERRNAEYQIEFNKALKKMLEAHKKIKF